MSAFSSIANGVSAGNDFLNCPGSLISICRCLPLISLDLSSSLSPPSLSFLLSLKQCLAAVNEWCAVSYILSITFLLNEIVRPNSPILVGEVHSVFEAGSIDLWELNKVRLGIGFFSRILLDARISLLSLIGTCSLSILLDSSASSSRISELSRFLGKGDLFIGDWSGSFIFSYRSSKSNLKVGFALGVLDCKVCDTNTLGEFEIAICGLFTALFYFLGSCSKYGPA